MYELQKVIRWPGVECYSVWVRREFPPPNPAVDTSSVPVAHTEAPVTEPTSSSLVNAMTADVTRSDELVIADSTQTAPVAGADTTSSPPADAMTVPSTTNVRTEATTALQEHKAAETSQKKHPGGTSPVWDWEGVIALLKQRTADKDPSENKTTFKNKTAFKNMMAFKQFIQRNVQRVDEAERGDGPDLRTVERAITKHNLEQHAIFEE
jgi:hypothetical protein